MFTCFSVHFQLITSMYKNSPSSLAFFYQRLNITSNIKHRNNLEENVCVIDKNNIRSMSIIKERRMLSYHNCEKTNISKEWYCETSYEKK